MKKLLFFSVIVIAAVAVIAAVVDFCILKQKKKPSQKQCQRTENEGKKKDAPNGFNRDALSCGSWGWCVACCEQLCKRCR